MCGEFEFDIYKIPQIQEKLYIDAKIREINIFLSQFFSRTFLFQKGVYSKRSHFRDFLLQYTNAIPESRKRFFGSKMSNSDSLHVFTPRGVISRKTFHVGP